MRDEEIIQAFESIGWEVRWGPIMGYRRPHVEYAAMPPEGDKFPFRGGHSLIFNKGAGGFCHSEALRQLYDQHVQMVGEFINP